MIGRHIRIGFALAIGMSALGFLGGPQVVVGQPADFYRGKTFEVIVGFSVGGGYDTYARALATVLAKHIPGNPVVVVKNYPGAGGLRLARWLQDVGPRDGLVIGVIDSGLLTASLLNPSVVFEAPKLSWVGSIAKATMVCMTWHTARVRTLDEMRNSEAVFGVTGREDFGYTSANVLRRVSGSRIKIVTGYPGSSDQRLALERGEIDALCETWSSTKATKREWIDQKKINVVAQFSMEPSPDLPSVPTIGSFAQSQSQAEALRLIFSSSEAGRPFAAPPGIPADRLAALRRAFDAAMKDPEFVATAATATLDVEPVTGEHIDSFLERAYRSPPEVVAAARKLMEP
jgi:tripartite-type tricarboxylate transporter receptor subunit TctC